MWHKCEQCGVSVWASIDRWPVVLCGRCAMRRAVREAYAEYGRTSLFWTLGAAGLLAGLVLGLHFMRG